MNDTADRYLDPEDYDPERPCTACGRHQGECDGPPLRCCEACEHWTALPTATDAQAASPPQPTGEPSVPGGPDDFPLHHDEAA